MKHNIQHNEVINGILYKNLTEEYRLAIIDFYFDVFLKDEPTTVAAGGYTTRDPNIIKQIEDIIDDGLSVIALDPDKDNKLIGMMISHAVDKDQVDPRSSHEENLKTFPPLHASIMTLFDEIMYPGDIFERNPQDKKYHDMFTLATSSGYRGRGIGRTLVAESLKMAKKADCDAAIVLATSDFSRKIFDKLGFEVIASKNWEDCIYNGELAFGHNVPSANATAHYLKL